MSITCKQLHQNYIEMDRRGVFAMLTEMSDFDEQQCSTRKDGIRVISSNTLGMQWLYTPCRLGRNILCTAPTRERCPLCSTLTNYPTSACPSFRQITQIRSMGLAIIPNMFPYFPFHFLITTPDHQDQTIISSFTLWTRLWKLVIGLFCTPYSTLFFNGMCGNSLPQFHVQYMEYHLPAYDVISDAVQHNLDTIQHQPSTLKCDVYIVNHAGGFLSCILFRSRNLNAGSLTVFGHTSVV